MISTPIALPYELARLPLVLADNALSERLPEKSAPWLALNRVIGSADQIAGGLLHNSAIAQRGSDRLERSQKLATAGHLEQEAASRREQAREAAAGGKQRAAARRKAAQAK